MHGRRRRTRGPSPSSRHRQFPFGAGALGRLQDRAAAGVPPLQWSGCLASIANAESVRQAKQGFISHAGGVNQDLGCGYSWAGENVGYTSTGVDDALLNSLFMNSPGHRAIITDCELTDAGFSAVSNGDKMTAAGDFGKK